MAEIADKLPRGPSWPRLTVFARECQKIFETLLNRARGPITSRPEAGRFGDPRALPFTLLYSLEINGGPR